MRHEEISYCVFQMIEKMGTKVANDCLVMRRSEKTIHSVSGWLVNDGVEEMMEMEMERQIL